MVYKLLASLILGSTLSFAGLINGVAVIVNDSPITLYDIDKTMVEQNVDKNQAVSLLIDDILYEQLVQQNNISADIFDVNNYIEKIAASNGMDLYSFKSIIRQKYNDYSDFEKEAKTAVIKQKLLQKIIRGQIKIATDEDMRVYYENNQKQFTSSKSIELVQYVSKNKSSLTKATKSPLLVPEDVQRTPLNLEVKELNPQLQYLLNNTKIGSFTPIFTSNKLYNSLYIIEKQGLVTLDYEVVKDKIFGDMMKIREKKFLKDYFEKEKLTADIKIVR